MRKSVVAGNWKMNMNNKEGARLAGEIVNGLKDGFDCEVVLFPSFTTIPSVLEVVRGSSVSVGGQNLYSESSGAFTGEISADMLKELGCEYVLVGHSERRHIFGEDSVILSKKLRIALKYGLSPFFCVGELLEQRESGIAGDVVERQLREVLEGLDESEISRVKIAYEPVWAIGTGKTATASDAADMHSLIREVIENIFSRTISQRMIIMYGGSVKPANAAELIKEKDIDGALVGGAALRADSFLEIIRQSVR
ncbi:MAG TPA: triose-phosphate isomerase [Candidatus Krumholzibacteriaceae bacterium]|nr:triose-phosphate isomerase [Candidatus Krumholzibacteriaceae bacterium]